MIDDNQRVLTRNRDAEFVSTLGCYVARPDYKPIVIKAAISGVLVLFNAVIAGCLINKFVEFVEVIDYYEPFVADSTIVALAIGVAVNVWSCKLSSIKLFDNLDLLWQTYRSR